MGLTGRASPNRVLRNLRGIGYSTCHDPATLVRHLSSTFQPSPPRSTHPRGIISVWHRAFASNISPGCGGKLPAELLSHRVIRPKLDTFIRNPKRKATATGSRVDAIQICRGMTPEHSGVVIDAKTSNTEPTAMTEWVGLPILSNPGTESIPVASLSP